MASRGYGEVRVGKMASVVIMGTIRDPWGDGNVPCLDCIDVSISAVIL